MLGTEALLLQILLLLRPDVNIVIEQPSGSWAFKMPFMVSLLRSFKMSLDPCWHVFECIHLDTLDLRIYVFRYVYIYSYF